MQKIMGNTMQISYVITSREIVQTVFEDKKRGLSH